MPLWSENVLSMAKASGLKVEVRSTDSLQVDAGWPNPCLST